jgi:carbon-monoxide dehydrogenase large subunit
MSSTFKGRREDFRLVTGQGRYTSDWSLPRETHACFLRADRAHAKLLSIDVSQAKAAPGVLAVITGAEALAAGLGAMPNMVKYPGKGGMKLIETGRDVLAIDRVRFVGQCVALVVAETYNQAMDASELIVAEYEDLPVVIGGAAALKPDAAQLYDHVPNNLVFDYEYGDKAKTDAAFAKADHVTKITLDAPRIVGNPMEPKACLVSYDAKKDIYDVYAPSQGITMIRPGLAAGTQIPEEKIRFHAWDVGGGFGVRSEAYSEYCALMMAAKIVGRPVKWVATRSETILSDHHGRGAILQGELAMAKDGTFLGMRIEWIVDCGGYLSGSGPLTNTAGPSTNPINVYATPAVYGLHRLVVTNATPTTPYRGAARPNVTYLAERLVDEAAREMGIDRIELRRKNLLQRKAFPYKTPTGSTYDSGDPPGLLADALKAADWKGVARRRKAAEKRGLLYGAGVAVFIEPSGGGGVPREEAAIKFGDNGNPVIFTVSGPSGQGHETVYPEIVASEFGLDPEQITLRFSDPDGPVLKGSGSIGSRGVMNHGGALVITAREVVRKGKEHAAKHLEAAEADIEFEKGSYRVRGTDVSVSLVELAKTLANKGENPLDTIDGVPVSLSFPTGAHIAEVEIDPATGMIDIVKYIAVDDSGNIINHALAEGQLHGGLMQGIGQVMGEVIVYDPVDGQPVHGSFMDYFMPRADLLPPLQLIDRPVPSPTNPLGAKGVGEAGATGSVPTVANAVIDALRGLGINHVELPFSPHRIWEAIHMNGKSQAVE